MWRALGGYYVIPSSSSLYCFSWDVRFCFNVPLNVLHLFCLLMWFLFPFIFGVQHFDCDVSKFCFLCIYLAWSLLNFLGLYLMSLINFGKLSNISLKVFLLLHFLTSPPSETLISCMLDELIFFCGFWMLYSYFCSFLFFLFLLPFG